MTSKLEIDIVLGKKITIENVAELMADWEEKVAPDAEYLVDATATEQVDTAGFQALIAFVNSAVNVASTIKWKGTEGVLDELAQLADVYGPLRIVDQSISEDEDGLCPVY